MLRASLVFGLCVLVVASQVVPFEYEVIGESDSSELKLLVPAASCRAGMKIEQQPCVFGTCQNVSVTLTRTVELMQSDEPKLFEFELPTPPEKEAGDDGLENFFQSYSEDAVIESDLHGTRFLQCNTSSSITCFTDLSIAKSGLYNLTFVVDGDQNRSVTQKFLVSNAPMSVTFGIYVSADKLVPLTQLESLIQSIKNFRLPKDRFEIILFFERECDDSIAIGKKYPDLNVIAMQSVIPATEALNFIATDAKCSIVVFLREYMKLEPNFAKSLFRFGDNFDVAAVNVKSTTGDVSLSVCVGGQFPAQKSNYLGDFSWPPLGDEARKLPIKIDNVFDPWEKTGLRKAKYKDPNWLRSLAAGFKFTQFGAFYAFFTGDVIIARRLFILRFPVPVNKNTSVDFLIWTRIVAHVATIKTNSLSTVLDTRESHEYYPLLSDQEKEDLIQAGIIYF